MYEIYADGNLIYSPDLVADKLYITGPTYDKEVNKSGSCKFNIYPENPYYNAVKPLKTQIVIKDNGEEVWRGRILNTQTNFDKTKSISCEGVQSFFVDSIIRPFKHTKTMPDQFRYIIEKHNEVVEDFKKFTVGTIDVDDNQGSKEWEKTGYTTAKDNIEGILSDYGGYLVIGWNGTSNTISYRKNPTKQTNQIIEFGENLLSLTDTTNPTNLFTVLIPTGHDANDNPIDIKPINDGKDYIESAEGISLYGRVNYQHEFSEVISSASELLQKGTDFLNKNIKASRTISVKALDLHILDSSIDKIDVFDLLKVHSEPHGVDEYQMCTKIKIDLESPDNNEYIIGTVPEGVESVIAGTSSVSISGGGPSLPNGDNIQY